MTEEDTLVVIALDNAVLRDLDMAIGVYNELNPGRVLTISSALESMLRAWLASGLDINHIGGSRPRMPDEPPQGELALWDDPQGYEPPPVGTAQRKCREMYHLLQDIASDALATLYQYQQDCGHPDPTLIFRYERPAAVEEPR